MTREPPPPPPDVRARILASARAEFARRGREASSVRTLASDAGVTAAMINYYFGGKDRLYEAVVEEAQGRLVARLVDALPAPGADRVALAVALAGAYFDFLVEERELQRILLREILDGGPSAARAAPLEGLLGRLGGGARGAQLAVSLFGAVAGYFLYEPMLRGILGDDPLAPAALRRRRRHVLALARALATDLEESP